MACPRQLNLELDSRDNTLTNAEQTNPVTMTYDAASRLVTSIQGSTTTTYTFDVNGNQTNVAAGASINTLTYDKENRVATNTAVSTLTYSYYSNGLLRNMQSSGLPYGRIRIWDANQVLLLQDGTLPTTYWWFLNVDGLVIAETYMDGVRGDFLVDFLGSMTGSTEPDGSGSSYVRYKPFGTTYTGSQFSQLYGWTGNTGSQNLSSDIVSQYNLTRVFSNKTKQWLTRDPIWPAQRPFAYVDGKVTSSLDPFGLYGGHPSINPIDVPREIGKRVEWPPRLPSLPHEGGVGIENCYKLRLPSIPLGAFSIEFAVRFCVTAYDPTCCPKSQQWATSCATIGGQVSVKTPSLLDFIKRFDADTLNRLKSAVNYLTDLFGGSLNLAMASGYPKQGCVPKSDKIAIGACVKGCASVVSGSACIHFSAPPPYWKTTTYTKYGWCGLPSVGLEFGIDYEKCT